MSLFVRHKSANARVLAALVGISCSKMCRPLLRCLAERVKPGEDHRAGPVTKPGTATWNWICQEFVFTDKIKVYHRRRR